MARRKNSLFQGKKFDTPFKRTHVQAHREHRSKKGRDTNYKNKRRGRIINREYEEKYERKYLKSLKKELEGN